MLWRLCCCSSVLAAAAGVSHRVHSWARFYTPSKCALPGISLNCMAHAMFQAKPSLLWWECVLGIPDDSSLLGEDDPHNLKGGYCKAKGAAMVSASAWGKSYHQFTSVWNCLVLIPVNCPICLRAAQMSSRRLRTLNTSQPQSSEINLSLWGAEQPAIQTACCKRLNNAEQLISDSSIENIHSCCWMLE